jgi:hypothetical protein
MTARIGALRHVQITGSLLGLPAANTLLSAIELDVFTVLAE